MVTLYFLLFINSNLFPESTAGCKCLKSPPSFATTMSSNSETQISHTHIARQLPHSNCATVYYNLTPLDRTRVYKGFWNACQPRVFTECKPLTSS
jgi:hypothetical protein